MENNFEINTGIIFDELQNQWENYDRNFLLALESPFSQILKSKKIVTQTYSENLDYYHDVRYPRDLSLAQAKENFPFPYYFLNYYKDSRGFDIIEYYENCEIDKQNKYYDLFFALKLSLIDIMTADEFLKYHLENTWKNDYPGFKTFLENVCFKYKRILEENYIPLIQRYLHQDGYIEHIKEGNKEFTTARQVLAIIYLLDELKVNRHSTSLTEIAKFIQFLTGKEPGAAKINDTTIYKRVKSPLTKTDKTAEKDLQFIRAFFEKLGLHSIVNKLNKEIGSKE